MSWDSKLMHFPWVIKKKEREKALVCPKTGVLLHIVLTYPFLFLYNYVALLKVTDGRSLSLTE